MGNALARAGTRAGTREPAPQRPGGRSSAACAPSFDIAANPATLRALMTGADAGTRERLADAVQRWAVGLPAGTTDCDAIITYMNTRSPYRANSGWARTNVSFSWGGDSSYSEANGVITATVATPTVTKTVGVDMPSWAPTNPAIAAGWSAMTGDLRAHEARHEAIATTWETTLRSRLTSLSVTVPNRTSAAFTAAVRAQWDSWIAEHQAAQLAIDPYTAIFSCPGGSDETESAGLEGDLGAAAED